MNDGTEEGAFLTAFVILLCFMALLWATPGESQAPTYQGARLDRSAALTGARLCVGETGFTDYDACTAQLGVIARRAARRGVSFSRMAELYSRALRSPQASRRWVPHLRDAPVAPQFWAGASWGAKRSLFADLLRHVESVLAGEVEDDCDADHFGSLRLDGHRARRAGWTRVCADVGTRQAFWRVR